MLSVNIQSVYKRLFVLALLSACLVVFGLSSGTESVYAARCIQDCEADEAFCYDNCAINCSGLGDAACSSCMSSCASEFYNCARHAEWCEGGGVSYTQKCVAEFAAHCPIIGGVVDCNHPDAHNAYYLTCETLGGNHCEACPHSGWQCGPGAYPSCY